MGYVQVDPADLRRMSAILDEVQGDYGVLARRLYSGMPAMPPWADARVRAEIDHASWTLSRKGSDLPPVRDDLNRRATWAELLGTFGIALGTPTAHRSGFSVRKAVDLWRGIRQQLPHHDVSPPRVQPARPATKPSLQSPGTVQGTAPRIQGWTGNLQGTQPAATPSTRPVAPPRTDPPAPYGPTMVNIAQTAKQQWDSGARGDLVAKYEKHAAWCADFVAAVATDAGWNGTSANDWNSGWVPNWVDRAQAGAHQMHIVGATDARPGDLVAFRWSEASGNHTAGAAWDHIGILTSAVDAQGSFTSIDGNWANAIASHKRPADCEVVYIRLDSK